MEKIRTIDEFIEHHMFLVAICDRSQGGCGRWQDVDMVKLKALLGGGFDLYDGRDFVRRRMKCSGCDKKAATFQLGNEQARRYSGAGGHSLSK